MTGTDAPTLDAYVTDIGVSSRIWCIWCARWHHHGHGGFDKQLGYGNGHRAAHCHDDASPYAAHGYILKEVGWWPDRPHWGALSVLCRGCRTPFYRNRPQRRWCGYCPRYEPSPPLAGQSQEHDDGLP